MIYYRFKSGHADCIIYKQFNCLYIIFALVTGNTLSVHGVTSSIYHLGWYGAWAEQAALILSGFVYRLLRESYKLFKTVRLCHPLYYNIDLNINIIINISLL